MNKRFTVTDHNYFNTGGHCMVSIFTVFDKKNKAVRYVIANDEVCNYQLMDTVGHEPPEDITYDDILLGSYDWHDFTADRIAELDIDFDEFELFKYCQFEFYKKFCKDFKVNIELKVDELPDELFRSLSFSAVLWHRNADAYITTDGTHVFFDELYDTVESDNAARELEDIKKFKAKYNSLLTEENIERLADSYITICVDGDSVKIPWNADTYDAIDTVLSVTINGW